MSNFSNDIKNFVQNGTYTYAFDSTGNLTFNSSSNNFNQVYLSLPLNVISYNSPKLSNFYTIDFQEFIPQSANTTPTPNVADLQDELDTVQQENASLQEQLNSLVNQIQSQPSAPTTSSLVTKQVIIGLRIALGQGKVDADFSSDFPYTPIKTS